MATLKQGIDVVTSRDAIIEGLYTLTDDDGEPIFPTDLILTGKNGQISTYGRIIGFFMIGDTKAIKGGLRGRGQYGEHEGVLLVLKPGEDGDVIDSVNEIGRKIELLIEDDPTFNTDGLRVMLSDTNPFLRRRVDTSDGGKQPEWCTALIVNFDVWIAKVV